MFCAKAGSCGARPPSRTGRSYSTPSAGQGVYVFIWPTRFINAAETDRKEIELLTNETKESA